jgi:WhiB family redox-sensing transcriptional regulator
MSERQYTAALPLTGIPMKPGTIDGELWKLDAACRGENPDLFFHPEGENPRSPLGKMRDKAARAICAKCEVQVECLDYRNANGDRYGVWGGQTELEIRRLP